MGIFLDHAQISEAIIWCDWIIFDWGEEGHLPCHVMGFADLSGLSSDYVFTHGGIADVGRGIFAIVECGEYMDNPDEVKFIRNVCPSQEGSQGLHGRLH